MTDFDINAEARKMLEAVYDRRAAGDVDGWDEPAYAFGRACMVAAYRDALDAIDAGRTIETTPYAEMAIVRRIAELGLEPQHLDNPPPKAHKG